MQSLWLPSSCLCSDTFPLHLVYCFLDCRSPHPSNTFLGGGGGIFSSSDINAKAPQETLQNARKEVAFQRLLCSDSHHDSLRDLIVLQGLTLNDFPYPVLVSSHPLSKTSEEALQLFLGIQLREAIVQKPLHVLMGCIQLGQWESALVSLAHGNDSRQLSLRDCQMDPPRYCERQCPDL